MSVFFFGGVFALFSSFQSQQRAPNIFNNFWNKFFFYYFCFVFHSSTTLFFPPFNPGATHNYFMVVECTRPSRKPCPSVPGCGGGGVSMCVGFRSVAQVHVVCVQHVSVCLCVRLVSPSGYSVLPL